MNDHSNLYPHTLYGYETQQVTDTTVNDLNESSIQVNIIANLKQSESDYQRPMMLQSQL